MKKRSPSADGVERSSGNHSEPLAKKRIGELLVEESLVKPHQLREALALQKESGERTAEALIHLGYLGIVDLTEFLARQEGIASVDLSQYEIPKDVCALIPREFAETHEVLPIDKMGRLLTVGMVFPLDSATIDELAAMTGLKVRALLCSPDDIRKAMERYYSHVDREQQEGEEGPWDLHAVLDHFTASTRLANVSALIRRVDMLPALPQTVHKVREAIQDPDVPMGEVADIVGLDPPVSAKLLQLVNSAAFGISVPVDNIRMAVKLLGLRETSVAVLSASVINILEKSKDFDYEAFWREAVFSASAARTMAAKRKGVSKPGMFCAGLLHDIGRFALSEAAPGRYRKIDPHLMGEALIQAEQAEFGIAHPEGGYVLASNWGLPGDIVESVRFHHAPQLAKTFQEGVAIVALSAHMGEAYGHAQEADEELFSPLEETLDLLDLDAATAIEIYSETAEDIPAHIS